MKRKYSGIRLPHHAAPSEEGDDILRPDKSVANMLVITPNCKPDETYRQLRQMFESADWWRTFLWTWMNSKLED